MSELREGLRKILCSDEVLDDAAIVLGKLVHLETRELCWRINAANINGYPEHKLVDMLSQGGLVKRGVDPRRQDVFVYSILPKGRELYENLMKESVNSQQNSQREQ
jgi:hypothetical protein